jgi:hypothetical protein
MYFVNYCLVWKVEPWKIFLDSDYMEHILLLDFWDTARKIWKSFNCPEKLLEVYTHLPLNINAIMNKNNKQWTFHDIAPVEADTAKAKAKDLV